MTGNGPYRMTWIVGESGLVLMQWSRYIYIYIYDGCGFFSGFIDSLYSLLYL